MAKWGQSCSKVWDVWGKGDWPLPGHPLREVSSRLVWDKPVGVGFFRDASPATTCLCQDSTEVTGTVRGVIGDRGRPFGPLRRAGRSTQEHL